MSKPEETRDDLIARLRTSHDNTVRQIGHVMGDDLSTVYGDAAAEIERLRAFVNRLAEVEALGSDKYHADTLQIVGIRVSAQEVLSHGK